MEHTPTEQATGDDVYDSEYAVIEVLRACMADLDNMVDADDDKVDMSIVARITLAASFLRRYDRHQARLASARQHLRGWPYES